MSQKAKSAIDVIYMINERLSNIESQLNLIDQNIKDLNNKVYVLNSRVTKSIKNSGKNISNVNNNLSENKETQEESGIILGNVKVYGYIVNNSKHPIQNVNVSIYKQTSKIRNFMTDKDGYWEARLPGGNYKVVYKHSKFKPIEKIINFDNNQKSYEVRWENLMLAVKILLDKNKRDQDFAKQLSAVVKSMKKELDKELSIINDSSCIEIVSGSSNISEGEIIVEFLLKKTISLSKESFGKNIVKELEYFSNNKC